MNVQFKHKPALLPAVIVAYHGGADMLDEICSRGIDCVRIQLGRDPGPNKFMQQYLAEGRDPSSHVVTLQGDDIDSLVQELKDLGVTHIIPADEAGVALTDILADRLGLAFNGLNGSRARRDKGLMHERVKKAGLRIPLQYKAASPAEVFQWMKGNDLEFPIVIKPVDGAGSAGVTRCHSEQEVTQTYEKIRALADQGTTVISVRDSVMAQELLQGTEYVVDTVSLDGSHRLTDIWRCKKGAHNGAAFVYEYFEIIDRKGEMQDRLFSYVCNVLNALEIKIGPGHAEVYVRPDGQPVLVEIAARIGGPRMPFATAFCTASGKSQMEYTIDAYLEKSRFHDDANNSYDRQRHGRMVFLINSEESQFQGLESETIKITRSLPSFKAEEWAVRPGDRLKATVDVRSSPGFFVLVHDDQKQIEADYKKIRELENRLYIRS